MNDDDKKKQNERLERLFDTPLGATGDFPDGQLDDTDRGGLRFEIKVHEGYVVMDFGESYIAFSPQQALDIIEALHQSAFKAAANVMRSDGKCRTPDDFKDIEHGITSFINGHTALYLRVCNFQQCNMQTAEQVNKKDQSVDTKK